MSCKMEEWELNRVDNEEPNPNEMYLILNYSMLNY